MRRRIQQLHVQRRPEFQCTTGENWSKRQVPIQSCRATHGTKRLLAQAMRAWGSFELQASKLGLMIRFKLSDAAMEQINLIRSRSFCVDHMHLCRLAAVWSLVA